MEGNIAPEVRDETGPDQREFNHDALGEEGPLMRKSLRTDLAPAVALCRIQKPIESDKRIGWKQQIDIAMRARRHQLKQLFRPTAEDKRCETVLLQSLKHMLQELTIVWTAVIRVHGNWLPLPSAASIFRLVHLVMIRSVEHD